MPCRAAAATYPEGKGGSGEAWRREDSGPALPAANEDAQVGLADWGRQGEQRKIGTSGRGVQKIKSENILR